MSGYIGTQPVPQATQHRETFTATASQTTFATVGYTPQFVDVYLNGIHLLDTVDYTATNSSDVVLTAGAAASDVVEIISYTPFEVANQTFTGTTTVDVLTTTGAFTSLGIDDNATSTAMTLDASGNLLVGKTTPSLSTAGTALRGDNAGLINSARNGVTLELNRLSTDGTIQEFFKDGSTVGSIGTASGDLTIGTGDTGLSFDDANDTVQPISATAGNGRDAALTLGGPFTRFKDLYLSGGVYLGGTGSANYLSDYEEGTWTPSFSTGSFGTILNFTYTKIGRVVHITGYLATPSGLPSSTLSISGLPFSGNVNFQMSLLWYNGSSSTIAAAYLSGGATTLQVRPVDGWPSTFSELSVQMTYITNS